MSPLFLVSTGNPLKIHQFVRHSVGILVLRALIPKLGGTPGQRSWFDSPALIPYDLDRVLDTPSRNEIEHTVLPETGELVDIYQGCMKESNNGAVFAGTFQHWLLKKLLSASYKTPENNPYVDLDNSKGSNGQNLRLITLHDDPRTPTGSINVVRSLGRPSVSHKQQHSLWKELARADFIIPQSRPPLFNNYTNKKRQKVFIRPYETSGQQYLGPSLTHIGIGIAPPMERTMEVPRYMREELSKDELTKVLLTVPKVVRFLEEESKAT